MAATEIRLSCGSDVDGTLLTATGPDANKLHKLAFAHAMKEIFEVDTNIGKLAAAVGRITNNIGRGEPDLLHKAP